MASATGPEEKPNSESDISSTKISVDSPSDNECKNVKIPKQKQTPDMLCTCPQKCDSRVPQAVRSRLKEHFLRLGDHPAQNAYLQSYIEMRSVFRRLWAEEEKVRGRLPRRVSCKYRVPAGLHSPPQLEVGIQLPKPKLTINSKGKATFVMNPRHGVKTIEVCQKAFMNIYGITEKRVRLQREKLIARLRDKSPPFSITQMEEKHYPILYERLDDDYEEEQDVLAVNIVDSFFQNQLWKPEYIGMQKEKIENVLA